MDTMNTIEKTEKYVFQHFLDFSVILTGFSQAHLLGTGQALTYFSTVRNMVGKELLRDLLGIFHRLERQSDIHEDPSILTTGLQLEILGSEKFGPVARNIIKLWYVATWYELPKLWHEAFGTNGQKDYSFVVSAQSYPEGLLWSAIGVNPPGAKAPGYGTWSEPPSVT